MPALVMIPRGIGCYPVGAKVYDHDGELLEVVKEYGLQRVAQDAADAVRLGYVCRTENGEKFFYLASELSAPDGAGYLQRVK